MNKRKWILGLVILMFPIIIHAATLVNINTASASVLDTLPYISHSTAEKIVEYRNTNGLFANIEDIEKVAGIKSGIFSHIKSLITVGSTSVDTVVPKTQATEKDTVANSTQSNTDTDVSANKTISRASKYIPPPASISIKIHKDTAVLVEVPVVFKSLVKTSGGSIDTSSRVHWSFGDGSESSGRSAVKVYHYAGTYRVVAIAEDGSASARSEITVNVTRASVRIADISGEGITLENLSDKELDLSNWRITSSKGIFRIPKGTVILPASQVLFPFSIMNLPISFDATLTYPDGVEVARYVPPIQKVIAKPKAQPLTFSVVKKHTVVPSDTEISDRLGTQVSQKSEVERANVAWVGAPAHTTFARSTHKKTTQLNMQPATQTYVYRKNPWTLGLLGALTVIGGALILL